MTEGTLHHRPVTGEIKLSTRVLGEAVDWLMRLQAPQASAADHEAMRRWRDASAQHAAAWARVEALQDMMQPLPQGLLTDTLQRVRQQSRRRAISALMIAAALPATWLMLRDKPWEQVVADLSTGVGERRSVQLPDGTTLVLNSHSAVDILFNTSERRVRLLAGEILITSAPDPAPVHRPLLVETPQGEARALGTRFAVRRFAHDSQVSVFQGAVEIHNNTPAQRLVLQAGEQSRFGPEGFVEQGPADPASIMWEHGMLVAKEMRLADLLAELSRYRRGVLRCDPAVANLRVTGAFPLHDIELSLNTLVASMPLRLYSVSRYWVRVGPA